MYCLKIGRTNKILKNYLVGNRWLNQKYNFDNLGHALMSLFVLSSKVFFNSGFSLSLKIFFFSLWRWTFSKTSNLFYNQNRPPYWKGFYLAIWGVTQYSIFRGSEFKIFPQATSFRLKEKSNLYENTGTILWPCNSSSFDLSPISPHMN